MKTFRYKFVEFMPEQLEADTLYISMSYTTAIHLCACGCGNEVVTPISPKDWEMTFNGKSISLRPSIGNWNFDCKSHYWIAKNEVVWANTWSTKKISDSRDKAEKKESDFLSSTSQQKKNNAKLKKKNKFSRKIKSYFE